MSVFDQVLVVDESPLVRRPLRSALEGAGYWVHETKDAAAARQLLAVRRYSLLVVGRIGYDLLPLARSAGAAFIVLPASSSADLHLRALRLKLKLGGSVRSGQRGPARPSAAA